MHDLESFRNNEVGEKYVVINCLNIVGIRDSNYELLRNSVSEARRRRADRFYFIADAYRSICAELLLQYSLYEATGQYMDIDFDYNPFGKPTVRNISEFEYNISHSGSWVVVAYANTEVGVDVEEIQWGCESIVNICFSEGEKDYIFSVTGSERSKRFTQIWTLKESYMKYLGMGFSIAMDSFSINLREGIITNKKGEVQDNTVIKNFLFHNDYYLSLCGREENVVINEVMMEDIFQFIKRKHRPSKL